MSGGYRKRPPGQQGGWGGKGSKRGQGIEPGSVGYLFTCDGHEKQAVTEAYNLLNKTLDSLHPHPNAPDDHKAVDDDEEDIADALKRECAESARPAGQRQRRLLQRPTGAKNTLFVASTAGEDKCDVARRLVEEVQLTGKSVCRFLQRVLPVEVTCKFYLDDVSKAAAQLISKHFANSDPPPSYAVMYKSRNQDKLTRKDAIDIITEAVQGVSPLSKVDLNDPDKAVIVEATRSIVCLSVVTDFTKLRKYSLQLPTPAKEEGKGKKEDAVEKNETEEEEEDDVPADEGDDEKPAV